MPRSVRMTGNSAENSSGPSSAYSPSNTATTFSAHLFGMRMPTMKPALSQWSVRRQTPPMRPMTRSMYTGPTPGLSARNFS